MDNTNNWYWFIFLICFCWKLSIFYWSQRQWDTLSNIWFLWSWYIDNSNIILIFSPEPSLVFLKLCQRMTQISGDVRDDDRVFRCVLVLYVALEVTSVKGLDIKVLLKIPENLVHFMKAIFGHSSQSCFYQHVLQLWGDRGEFNVHIFSSEIKQWDGATV